MLKSLPLLCLFSSACQHFPQSQSMIVALKICYQSSLPPSFLWLVWSWPGILGVFTVLQDEPTTFVTSSSSIHLPSSVDWSSWWLGGTPASPWVVLVHCSQHSRGFIYGWLQCELLSHLWLFHRWHQSQKCQAGQMILLRNFQYWLFCA